MARIKIGILGAGAFGTSLAILYSNFGVDVTLFSGFEEHAESMRLSRKNEFLDEFIIPEGVAIDFVSNIKNYEFEYILWCFPSQPTLSLLPNIGRFIKGDSVIIICAKGLSPNCKFLTDEFNEVLGNDVGVLSGPNFATEIASLKFSKADIGMKDIKNSIKVAHDLSNDLLRLIPNDDVTGMQICGAIKNVIAIACGICDGLDLGENTFAAMLTAGLREMCDIGIATGAKAETFYGLSGIGDLFLTASSETSRNMSLGRKIAIGDCTKDGEQSVAEGVVGVKNVIKICDKFKINSPICRWVFDVIYNAVDPRTILNVLK